MDILSERFKRHKRAFEKELEGVRKFLDAREITPDFEQKLLENPYVEGSTANLNPIWPTFAARHEARHLGQSKTVERLGYDFREESKEFYRKELEDLNMPYNIGGITNRILGKVRSSPNIDFVENKEERLDELNGRDTMRLIGGKNYLTSEQQEVWASEGYLVPRMAFAVGLGASLGDKPDNMIENAEYFKDSFDIWSQVKDVPGSTFDPLVTNEQMVVLTALGIGYTALNMAAYGGAGKQV